jgi:hypothetical protein
MPPTFLAASPLATTGAPCGRAWQPFRRARPESVPPPDRCSRPGQSGRRRPARAAEGPQWPGAAATPLPASELRRQSPARRRGPAGPSHQAAGRFGPTAAAASLAHSSAGCGGATWSAERRRQTGPSVAGPGRTSAGSSGLRVRRRAVLNSRGYHAAICSRLIGAKATLDLLPPGWNRRCHYIKRMGAANIFAEVPYCVSNGGPAPPAPHRSTRYPCCRIPVCSAAAPG